MIPSRGATPPRLQSLSRRAIRQTRTGAALPWPASGGEESPGHRPGRKAGALVVLVEGELVLFVERGGRTILTFTDDGGTLRLAALSLARR